MEQHKSALSRKLIFALCIIILATVGLVIYLARGPIHDTLDNWGVLPRPERLTELYFTDHTKLPVTYSAGQPYTVAFTIHNIEYRTTDYRYRIEQSRENGSDSHTLASGTIKLEYDVTREIITPITYRASDPRSKIHVIIEYDTIKLGDTSPSRQQQEINYWVTRNKEG